MVELSDVRLDQILHKETTKKEETDTILRSIYTRYMRLFEKYFADIDALNDSKIAEFRNYHEETISLIKYYYMDIPMDVCTGLRNFEKNYSDNLLGDSWYQYLFESYDEFREKNSYSGKIEKLIKEEFVKQALSDFYDAMDYVFRDGFGTGSQIYQNVQNGITGLLFRKDK